MDRARVIATLVVIAKAILLAGAILFLGSYFGLRVREAGGSVVAIATGRAWWQ
jgi:hypothetical protein